MKIKFNSDEDLPLKKMLKLCNVIIFVRSAFQESNIYNSQVFLDEYIYKLPAMYINKFSE